MKPRKRFAILKWLRRAISWGLLALLLLALGRPDTFQGTIGVLSRLQFGQLMAGFFSQGGARLIGAFLSMAVLSAIFGRFFCGFICPMGAAMDLAFLARSRIRGHCFAFRPSRSFRLLVPVVLLALFWLGLTLPFGQIEPYSLMAGPSILTLLVLVLAAFRGRAFCNSLCPTGLVLRLISGSPALGLWLDPGTCLGCGACQRVCPASCLDGEGKSIDSGRCLLCLECASACPNGSLGFGRPKGPTGDPGKRRAFLRLAAGGALAAGAFLTSPELRVKALATPDQAPILPPGALSLAHFNAHCSLCHTCVRACPNLALRPSPSGFPILRDKPVLDAYEGFCQYDCVVCSKVCPTGAIRPLSVEAKRLTRLGLADLDRDECVVVKNGSSCGACAEL
ncbi:MAG: 4Fe-4S binding protein [Deltaproteobacteria bacterium]|jgi:polyferredoxin|nr:4Fe-4S binding protein [Deltaproteobacteria bacterium]